MELGACRFSFVLVHGLCILPSCYIYHTISFTGNNQLKKLEQQIHINHFLAIPDFEALNSFSCATLQRLFTSRWGIKESNSIGVQKSPTQQEEDRAGRGKRKPTPLTDAG